MANAILQKNDFLQLLTFIADMNWKEYIESITRFVLNWLFAFSVRSTFMGYEYVEM